MPKIPHPLPCALCEKQIEGSFIGAQHDVALNVTGPLHPSCYRNLLVSTIRDMERTLADRESRIQAMDAEIAHLQSRIS